MTIESALWDHPVGTSVSLAPYDDDSWTDPLYISSQGSYYASVAGSYNEGLISQLLCAKFPYDGNPPNLPVIPNSNGGTIIHGIKVVIWKRWIGTPDVTGETADYLVSLGYKGVPIGQNKADLVTHLPHVNTEFIHGGETDLWGLSYLSPNILNSTDFCVYYANQSHGAGAQAGVDHINMTIYYEVLAGVPRRQNVHRGKMLNNVKNLVSNNISESLRSVPVFSIPLTIGDEYDDVLVASIGTAVYPFTDAGAVTISIASPGVFGKVGHGLAANREVWLKTSGALPTGLTQYTHYYVKDKGVDDFYLATTPGGANINTSVSQSGTHNIWTKDI